MFGQNACCMVERNSNTECGSLAGRWYASRDQQALRLALLTQCRANRSWNRKRSFIVSYMMSVLVFTSPSPSPRSSRCPLGRQSFYSNLTLTPLNPAIGGWFCDPESKLVPQKLPPNCPKDRHCLRMTWRNRSSARNAGLYQGTTVALSSTTPRSYFLHRLDWGDVDPNRDRLSLQAPLCTCPRSGILGPLVGHPHRVGFVRTIKLCRTRLFENQYFQPKPVTRYYL